MQNFSSLSQQDIANLIINKTSITFYTSHEIAKFSKNFEEGQKEEINLSIHSKEFLKD